MTLFTDLLASVSTVGAILVAMAVVALVEVAIPLHARGRANRVHLAPNLALTFITFATNVVLNGGVLVALAAARSSGFGLVPWLGLPPVAEVIVAVAILDLSFYVCHVAMHEIPALWRFHRVHHTDAVVDVTTTIRQHPGEGVIRYAFMLPFATALGASPAAFGVYRVWSALNGLLEHANVRVPRRLDAFLALLTTFPDMHKVHHSRIAAETDTNYGNIFSLWDRLFATFTPSARGASVVCGLDGFDDPTTQSTAGLLALPFRPGEPSRGAVVAASSPTKHSMVPKCS